MVPIIQPDTIQAASANLQGNAVINNQVTSAEPKNKSRTRRPEASDLLVI